MTIATGILVMVALTVGGTLAAAVIYALATHGRNWRAELFSVRILPFVFVGLAVGVVTFAIGFVSMKASDEALRLAVDDIEADCDDQLTLLLQADAGVYIDEISKGHCRTLDDLRKISDYFCIDEATIYDRDGCVVLTTDPGLKVGDTPFASDNPELEPYRALLTGTRKTIRQRFRPNVNAPERIVKSFARVLPQGGIIQIGFLWEAFEQAFREYFQGQFECRAVGETGCCLVFDGQDRLVQDALGHPGVKGLSAAQVGLTPQNLDVPLGTVFRARLFGIPCRCMFYRDKIADLKIMAAVPLSEGQDDALALAITIAVVLFAAFLCFRLVLRKFRMQQARIDALRAEEEAHRARDLALARAIQCAELRTDGTEGGDYRLTTLMNAAREVGGDFYDYYELPDGRLVVTVADVSGKGIPAAFFMMKSRVMLKHFVHGTADLAGAIARTNLSLARKNPAEMFVTAWVGVFDRRTGTLDYVSAGHNPPLVRRADGSVAWLDAPRAAALGVFETAKYRGAQATLASGDRLFLYTDGVTEAMDATGALFGNERLEAALKSSAGDGLVASVRRAVEAFVAGAEQSDDITMLELHVS